MGGIPPTWTLFDAHRMRIGVFASVGLAAVARIRGSTFLTFLAGVVKSGQVISGDLSITDSTLTLCAQGGIRLGADHHAALGGMAALLSPRHVIARNAVNVLGAGIVSRARFTSVEDNTIVCPVTAVVVGAADGVVRGNTLGGLAPEARSDAGLVEVGARIEGVVIASNHLVGAPGHGILLRGDVRRMDVLDNVIEKTRGNGLSAVDDTVTVLELRIARNRFESCRGGEPEAWPWRAGGIVLARGEGVAISDNRFLRNGPREPEAPGFAVVSLEDVAGAEITHNGFDKNTGLHTKGGQVVIHVSAPSGGLRICGNTLEGNGGQALRVEEESNDVAGQVMVHDNRFRGGSDLMEMPWIDVEAARLSWQGNVSLLQEPGEAPSIRLRTTQAVVSGNTARRTGQATAMRVECQEPEAGRLVASGNLTTGKLEIVDFPSGGVADPGNLVLP